MSKSIEASFDFIKKLSGSSFLQRKQLLKHVSNKDLKALSELCLNLILGNIKIDKKLKTKFKRYKKPIQLLANKRIPLKKKKRIINQKGSAGFLLPLASIALPLIADFVRKISK